MYTTWSTKCMVLPWGLETLNLEALAVAARPRMKKNSMVMRYSAKKSIQEKELES